MKPDLRDKDIAVLQAIQNGAKDTSEIREATTLTNREINYSINQKSLEEHGLVNVKRPKGREQREVNGGKTSTWKAKRYNLTDKGIRYLKDLDQHPDQYEELEKRELIERIQELEERQDRLESMFKQFRSKVMENL
jgi:hypothetical protein